jgi:uncharacterized protein YyaL (SSP411 family)
MTEFRFSPRPNRANEIAWRPWGPEAFREAQLAERPILLGISAVWCHWCHVMDETTYSDPGVIQLVNDRYIPVRVDNDQRPDVNRRYNMGGWPSTAFLTPDGEIITGGTYLPPDVMRQYLGQVADIYRERRGEIQQRVAEMRLQEAQRLARTPGPLQWSIVDDIVRHVRGTYDPQFGGFGREPKFPQAHVLRLLLDEHRRNPREETTTAMLHKTLAAMAGGGMYDRVEGGFFRYATQRDWGTPHYEKMLEDNSALLGLYAEAHRSFPEGGYDKVVADVIRWMDASLWQERRRLYGGSQDADEDYYARDASARAELTRPYVDPIAYTNWNALAASGLAAAAEALDDSRQTGRAATVLGAIRAQLWDETVGTYHFDAGDGPQLPSLLTDMAAVLSAEVDLCESGGGSSALGHARRVADRLLGLLEDTEHGGFYDAPRRDEPGRVSRPDKPIDDNAIAADALLRLATLSGEERWREAGLRALRAFVGEYREWGQFAALYARAVARAISEPLHLVVVGAGNDPSAQRLWAVSRRCDDPALIRQRLEPQADADREMIEARSYLPNEVAAYVCVGTACSAPIADPAELQHELERARDRFSAAVS